MEQAGDLDAAATAISGVNEYLKVWNYPTLKDIVGCVSEGPSFQVGEPEVADAPYYYCRVRQPGA